MKIVNLAQKVDSKAGSLSHGPKTMARDSHVSRTEARFNVSR